MGIRGFLLRNCDGQLVIAGGYRGYNLIADRMGHNDATFRSAVIELGIVAVHQEAGAAEVIRAWIGSQPHRFRAAGWVRERAADGVHADRNRSDHRDFLHRWIVDASSVAAVASAKENAIMRQSSG